MFQICHIAPKEEEEESEGDQLAGWAASGEPPSLGVLHYLPDIVGHPGEQLVLHTRLPEVFPSI